MPLRFPEPPKESLVSLSEGLSRLPAFSRHAFTTEAAGGARPNISLPHQVFVLNPEDIRRGAGLDAAKPTSWRYILNQEASGLLETSSTATAEVLDRGGAHVFSNLQHGWLANSLRRAVAVVRNISTVQKGTFDLRMLRIPAVRVDSLWLKGNTASDDILVPIRSAIAALIAFQTYGRDEFLSRVRDYLEKQEPFDNTPRIG
jgi:hypothetical protein